MVNRKNKLDFPKRASANRFKFSIIVPSTTKKDRKISTSVFNRRVTETKRFVNRLFGGSTIRTGQGSFLDNKGRLIKEKVVSVESFATKKDYLAKDKLLEAFLKSKKKTWGQESIGFVFESPKRPASSFHFI